MDKSEVSEVKFFLYVDPGAGYRWVLRSEGKRILDSERAYGKKADCQRAIEAVKKQYPDAVVRDLTR